ncbi:28 kDa heat- and acid-stable phosphoprotein [Calliphora vicina]|uniref:28 kDa heat- and acid-stable phosphoprotein n=1 Tax=Calliphora vicina TaxID=7373 RepID=UPI00325B484E
MPRGKYVNHKGRSRHFTSPEELQQESDEESSSAESSGEEDDQPGGSSSKARGAKPKSAAPAGKMPTSSEESDEDSEDDRGANKGVAGLIEIENPNRAVKKATQKVAKINIDGDEPAPKPELSRRDREQIEKQKARQRYEKLHAEGKTAQAKADLARLALIRQQRADAAAKREGELKKKATDDKKAAGKA